MALPHHRPADDDIPTADPSSPATKIVAAAAVGVVIVLVIVLHLTGVIAGH
jgi:hypothetical protein